MTILLIFGGKSLEHEVSLVSAHAVEKYLQKANFTVLPVYVDKKGVWHRQKKVYPSVDEVQINPSVVQFNQNELYVDGQKVDFVFPMIHGSTGEDGSLQGLCEMYGIPYAGSGILTSAICLDKYYMRTVFKAHGLPQVKYEKVDFYEMENWPSVEKRLCQNLRFPLFTKPCNCGSSIGVHKVIEPEELYDALVDSFRFDRCVLVEEGDKVRELEVGIMGNLPDYELSLIGEIVPTHEFYSYEAKYQDSQGAEFYIPARISQEQEKQVFELAKKAFAAVRGSGFARVDFFLRENDIFLNEINTIPGFTSISMFPKLFEATGLSPENLVLKIVEYGLKLYKQKERYEIPIAI